MNSVLFLVSFLVAISTVFGLRVHVVTWNVADNSRMDDGLPGNLLDKVLRVSSEPAADVYAISLQENCFQCDSEDVHDIAQQFINRLKIAYADKDYQLEKIEMTRDDHSCELKACSLSGLHGTTLMMVIVIKGMVSSSDKVKVNKCVKPALFGYRNSEKGIAGVKVKLSSGKTLCFAGGHLDSKNPEQRQKCVRDFFTEASSSWATCDKMYIMGDFNTRTGVDRKDKDGKQGVLLQPERMNQLFKTDEMAGETPFGGVTLLSVISNASGRQFVEPLRPLADVPGFAATYSLLKGSYCNDKGPCYREARSPAWTDRIVCYQCGTIKVYTSLAELFPFSDHLPVIGIYED